MKTRNTKKIPVFKNEDEERKFWAKADTADYFDWSRPLVNPVFPNLAPSTRTISIRLPQLLLNELKTLAHKKDVPYQALMKQFLSEKVKDEYAA
jgi:predicted DNA binding CopG/RHH family protein